LIEVETEISVRKFNFGVFTQPRPEADSRAILLNGS
jgi:hypothetical protein